MQHSDSDILPESEHETYGVDWAAFLEPAVVQSHLESNNITEETTAWLEVAEAPPPDRLNTVTVEVPACDLSPAEEAGLYLCIQPLLNQPDTLLRVRCWTNALLVAQQYSSSF
jgi:hypothetical protein